MSSIKSAEKFINENSDQCRINLERYALMNRITPKFKRRQFPYNLLSTVVIPTYKTINLQIKDKKFYERKGGLASPETLVFLY